MGNELTGQCVVEPKYDDEIIEDYHYEYDPVIGGKCSMVRAAMGAVEVGSASCVISERGCVSAGSGCVVHTKTHVTGGAHTVAECNGAEVGPNSVINNRMYDGVTVGHGSVVLSKGDVHATDQCVVATPETCWLGDNSIGKALCIPTMGRNSIGAITNTDGVIVSLKINIDGDVKLIKLRDLVEFMGAPK